MSRATAAAIRDWARRFLEPDPHGAGDSGDEYRIATIYFDTPEHDVFYRRRSFGRSKYRIRRYDGGADVFLERKLRQPRLLAKRRTLVPAHALDLLEGDALPDWAGQWFRERVRLRQLRPVCEIAYARVARLGDTPAGPVRLTLDDQLGVAQVGRLAFEPREQIVPLLRDHLILELKYRREVPVLFKRLVEEFGLRPQAASKYRLGMAALDPRLVDREASRPAAQDAATGLPCA